MFTITFGIGSPQSVTADNLYAAIMVADALTAKGWLGVKVTDTDGHPLPWRTLTATDYR